MPVGLIRETEKDRVGGREGELYTLHLCQLFCYGCLHHRTKIIYLFPSQSAAHTQKAKRKGQRGCGSIETDADLQYTSTHCVITRRRERERGGTERYAPLFYPKQRLSTAPVLVSLSQAQPLLPLGPRSCAHSFNLTNGTDYRDERQLCCQLQ